MLRRQGCALGLLVVGSLLSESLTERVLAVPYASGVRDIGGNMREFVLNEAADSVTVKRNGANPVTFTAPVAGRYSFDMTGFSSFDIEVNKNAAAAWTELSAATNAYTRFFRPSGLTINTSPASQYFGTVYVANGNPTATGSGRPMGDGIYSLTADLQGVDLSTANWAVPAANDATQARAPAPWTVAGSQNSPYRISLDYGGNLIVGDWSDANGGIKYASPNLTTGGLVLEGQTGPKYGYLNPDIAPDGSQGSPFVHGSIRGVPNATGTVGVDLVVRALDEDLNRDPIILLTNPPNPLPDDGNHIWRWNVGAATSYDQPPRLLIDVGNDPGQLGADTAGRPYMLDLNIGVRADAEFFPQLGTNGLWILTQPRTNGDESGITIVKVDDTGVTPNQVLWSSRQFTIDNGLDGFPNDPVDLGQNPNSDVFRNTGTVDVSPDGTKLFIHRWLTDNPTAAAPDVNPYVGQNSPLPGAILVVPLNSSGIPNIVVDKNGTPADPLDDKLTNLQSIATTSQLSQNENHEIETDAAGNVYITDNSSEKLQVFSPGGNTRAITRSNGTFTVGPPPAAAVPGDYNGDTIVNAADYNLWVSKFGQPVAGSTLVNLNPAKVGTDIDASDYTFWRDLLPGPSAAAAVPEPAAVAIVLMALAGIGGVVRRSRN